MRQIISGDVGTQMVYRNQGQACRHRQPLGEIHPHQQGADQPWGCLLYTSTGSLYSVLGRFAMLGLNLTKIESRPIPDRKFEHYFEYFFYLDFIGSVRDDKVLDLICALSDERCV